MMQANWSLILNILLLVGVIAAIGRLMKARKQSLNLERVQPSNNNKVENSPYDMQVFHDDIIAVRKVKQESLLNDVDECEEEPLVLTPNARSVSPSLIAEEKPSLSATLTTKIEPRLEPELGYSVDEPVSVMMFLLAKENRQFAGYELLQTVLASGLRFGEGHLFHRHQFASGQGPVLCSLAAATTTGIFDLQNIGAFSVRGLCLFMTSSNNSEIDAERFAVMLDTARQLREGLDAHLLDDQRKPLTQERLNRYYQMLRISAEQVEFETA